MNRMESRAVLAGVLLKRVREDRYPSSTEMDLIEQILPPQLLPRGITKGKTPAKKFWAAPKMATKRLAIAAKRNTASGSVPAVASTSRSSQPWP